MVRCFRLGARKDFTILDPCVGFRGEGLGLRVRVVVEGPPPPTAKQTETGDLNP